ncbi:deazaflavin-dependent oxidoreductase, nitroreductase family [Streptomyces qinglanensis]|uniref:Deazaflavin-dependent oxidoreductase, nitroreductase family n=1 Tax=Streptomyces qinglanensis TaxID=943816 RepID=A0A1H9W166_9ACTN|nr:deazaflavin-dependent oxidoreductase, nitroreductase family [Streptomyces qinglanensis]
MAGSGTVKLIRRASSTRAFARIAPYVIPALDRAVHRLSGGRTMLSTRLLPGVVLTSTGARSGQPRRTPLACLPEEGRGSWLLAGSNFGRPGHPAWSGNLRRNPEAWISYRGRDIPVRARQLEGDERERAWRELLRFWPPYAAYQSRTERRIRIFRLERRVPGRQEPGGRAPVGPAPGGQEPGGPAPGGQEPGGQEPGSRASRGQERGRGKSAAHEPGHRGAGGREPEGR